MVKEKEQDQEKETELPDWLQDFTIEKIKASAEVNILPKLTIDGVGIEFAKAVELASVPYKVKIPITKSIDGKPEIFVIDVIYDNTLHQFTAQSGSFRFQLGALKEKLGLKKFSDIIGLKIKLWKQKAKIKSKTFSGEAVVYVLMPNF